MQCSRPLPPGVEITAIAEHHAEDFNAVINIVALERRYIAFTEALPLERTIAFVRGTIANGDPQLVALADGKVIGWCDVLRGTRGTDRHCGTLGMGLLPEWRGRGIGRSLITETIARARAAGMSRIQLDVYASNTRALALYESVGFVREGVKRKAFLVEGRSDDAIMMAIVN